MKRMVSALAVFLTGGVMGSLSAAAQSGSPPIKGMASQDDDHPTTTR
jgi:hypothetical protein